ncbi:hypothetical protein SDRG_15418 [Saprolegnia diclina VS20]|uniref:Uncharacterized protein n=1 Tax=Saprolegnia diclina (strain VS20) TaxID=1156394 RepID=T0R3Z9_SAPDV|nr:hypothetical protein SDRG_15418 [Saprolegnia diclina VS20]EQC26768.1 hypothetical protein SDRG_15418 [Saprolegnia diclina VS20]|eukprot:XP_008619811.1 hypothetical protein SDRG_15418 [Saprolegnia diclina VS20]
MSASGVITRITPSRQQYIFGAVLARLSLHDDDYSSVCRHEPTFATQCSVYLPTTLWYIDQFMQLPPTIAREAVQMQSRVQAMDISFLNFIKTSAIAPLTLQRVNLLDATESDFGFFAWLFLYDWVLGVREVVSFQGDNGVLTLLTDSQSPLSQATQAWEVPGNIAQYLHSGVLYVTGVMIAVASLAFVYILVLRGHFEGWNMLELGRVGGIVWVGRPFLLLRSVTAMVVLSTATLQLQYSGYISYFTTIQDPWYKTVLAANEVTWLITIVNDVLLVITGEYAYYYVSLNSYLVWAVVALLTLLSPVTPTTSLALTCRLTHVDLDAACTVGVIDIGSLRRMLLLVATVLVSHIACYGLVKLLFRASSAAQAPSLFLSSGAKYQFTHEPWRYNNVYYVDRASAALDGLLTLRWNTSLVVLDVKIWRAFAIPMSATMDAPDALAAALPLLD